MKKNKRSLAIVAMLVMCFSLVACGSTDKKANSTNTTEIEEVGNVTEEPTATPEPTPEPTATPEPTPEPTATPEPEVWGDNKFEAFLPEPPKGYEYHSEDWESMTFVVKDITADELKVWEDYIFSLTDYGFEVKDFGDKSYRVKEASGNFANFTYWKEDQMLGFSIYIVY